MTTVQWILSLCALAWLAILWYFERRQPAKLGVVWIIAPFLLAAAYQVVGGGSPMLAAAAIIVLLVAERKHLKSRLLEWIFVVAAIMVISWMLFTTKIDTAYGIIGILVFWFSWELHAIDGEEAIILMTCQVLWPGIEFITACLVVVVGWAFITRIRTGGWLKRHDMPGRPIVAVAAAVFLAYMAYKTFL